MLWLWINKKKPHHELMLTITDHDIINTAGGEGGGGIVYVDFLRPTLNHGIIANADDVQCNSVNKTKTNNYTRLAVVEVMHG